MSLSISMRDVGSSWGDTGKILAAQAVGAIALVATEYFISKAFNCFNMPLTPGTELELAELTQDQIAERHRAVNRNLMIQQTAASVMMVAAPACLPIKFAVFEQNQNVQLVILDALVYGVIRQVFRGNHVVESKGIRFLILSRTLMGGVFAQLGSHSKLVFPVLGAVHSYVAEHHRFSPQPNFLIDTILHVINTGEHWASESVHDVEAAVDDLEVVA